MNAQLERPGMIQRADGDDPRGVDMMFSATYGELRKLARARLRRGGGDAVLDTTSLVHESYLRVAGGQSLPLTDRSHFIRYVSRAMRSVVVDYVRKRRAERRGGDAEHVTFTTQLGDRLMGDEVEILRVREALDELARLDPRLAQVVEMRYFAGMTEREIAQTLGLTERTVRRDWERARTALSEALQ